MNKWTFRLLLLDHCPTVTWTMKKNLLQHDPTLVNLFEYSSLQLANILNVSMKTADKIHHHLHEFNILPLLKVYEREKILIVTIHDKRYPPLLKQIFDPPFVLYCKGNIKLLQTEKLLSVVGTRTPTTYGKRVIPYIVKPLLLQNWHFISGLALGIDELVHIEAIKNGGKTIAVLGSGVLQVYPEKNKGLAKIIGNEHLLISEYPPLTKPLKWHFPQRNRIISGLSMGTLIIEAKEKSGSLITADQAMEQGREVFAVPGPIYEQTSFGTNKLIQHGAKLVTNYEDILNELSPFSKKF
ncbi:DNA-processing protein DprA [Sutcliffiella cohnii]